MRVLLLAFCFVMMLSCNRNLVGLEYTNARDEVPQLGNLVFRFNKALVPDSLLNEWDSTQYVRFEPAITGKFRWQQPDELVFSPSQPLPPSTAFTAEITSEVYANSSFTGIDHDGKISFHTPSLRLEDLNVVWIAGTNASAQPKLDLYFNYRVSPADLKSKLKVEIDSKPVAFDVVTLSDDSRVSLMLRGIQARDGDLQGRVTIDKNLMPKGGTLGTAEQINAEYTVPSPFNLVVHDVISQHDGISGTVMVSTSQQLASTNIASMVSVDPAVRFTVEANEEGFVLRSDQFDADKSYAITLKKGIRGNVGGVLQEEYNNNIAFGELEPSIRFVSGKGVYLSSAGNRMLEVKMVNVPKIKVIISKIYESNLLTARNYGYEPRESNVQTDDFYGEGNDEYGYASMLSMGDIIYEKEIETISLPKIGSSRLFQFNVEDQLPDFKGIYHIMVRSTQSYWMRDSRFVALSDIGLVAREGRDKLFVFANSLKNATAQPGVNVVAYGSNNQVLGTGATNQDGVAEIAYSRKEYAGFKPAMIVAKTEDDFTYLPFASSRVNTSRFEVGGKRINATALDAFIYAERDIYRPGERVNFSIVVRDPSWNVPSQIPVKFRFLYPNGKEFRVFRKTLNEQGAAEGQIDVPASAITGTYTLEAYSSNDILIASSNFNIEEFVPDRIKVSANLDNSALKPGQTGRLAINAINFFGPPAAGRNYELEVQVKAKDFSSKKYSRFNFALLNRGISLDNVLRQGKLDENGNASEPYEVPAMFAQQGLLQADFYTTVFDETGRPVSRLTTADLVTQPVFLGIGEDDYWYYALNQPIRFPIIAVDASDRLANGTKADVKVIKREYRTVLAKSGSYFRYQSQETEKIVAQQQVTVSGENTSFQFVPRSPGNYEFRVSIPGSDRYVGRTFYSYGSWGADAGSFEVDTDGNIDIETDKSTYVPGDKAKILFKTPFNGRLLVTIEQDKVLSYQYVDVAKRSASIELPLTQAHLPNAFITATLIKPHGISEIPLTVAHGFQNIKVEEKGRKNDVQIVAAKTSRSKTTQQVTVKAAPGSYVTLAAVDNGVLQVSDFKTPDPYEFFYANRALQVNAYDMYPLLFPELRARLSTTGGDAGVEMDKRVNPMPAKRFEIMSYWSGIMKTNGNGTAKFTVPISQFSGQVRLMAVAYKNESFGSAEQVMTVADPLVISTGLPRFLSPGDTLDIPVTIANTLAKSASGTATIRVSKPLSVVGASSGNITISANSEQRPVFRITAGAAVDTARIVVDVQALGEKFSETISISIRPTAPLTKTFAPGIIASGKTQKLTLPASNFLPGTAKYTLLLSRNPALEVVEQLRYVVQYPYGCTEQVVSSAFPQLYYADLASLLNVNDRQAQNANRNVIEAIRTIQLRQLYNGALTLWEGSGEEHWWTTIYATHFLIEARKAGFDVDASLMNTMLNYINSRLRNKATINYYYNRDQNRKIAPKEIAYGLYVLALASRPNNSAMNYYKANTNLLSLDSKYLLAAAYATVGDKKKFAELLPSTFSGEVSVPQTGGSFYSYIRDEAIALNTLIDVDPENRQIPVMAKHVAQELKNRSWFSTQECAFSFLAIGKMARSLKGNSATAEVRRNGKVVARFDGKDVRYSFNDNAGDVEVFTKGSGNVFSYFEAEGISATGDYREEDSYLAVRKKFFDRNGRQITNGEFKRNDLVIVQLTLSKTFNTAVENVVVTDMLPAGFEIENPRTREIPGMNWIRDASTPTQLDVRDDRINLFVDVTANKQVYYYAVRAVTPGVFNMGPVAADAMYNGEYHSYNGAGSVRINE